MGSDYIMDYRYWKEPESDSLMHYGVLGMRWGVRKANKEIARGGTDLKRAVKTTAINKFGSAKDPRVKAYISEHNASIHNAMSRRRQKAREALAANKGIKGLDPRFAAKSEEKRNRKLMPESYKKHDQDRNDELTLRDMSALSLLALPVAMTLPAVIGTRAATRHYTASKLDESIKKMSLTDVANKVKAYSDSSSDTISPNGINTKKNKTSPADVWNSSTVIKGAANIFNEIDKEIRKAASNLVSKPQSNTNKKKPVYTSSERAVTKWRS